VRVRCLVALVVLLGLAHGCGGTRPGRVLVLGLDGVDPRIVDLLMAEGKLPNFATLRQGGAHGRLLSSRPILSPIIWTTIATGRPPSEHGIGHFVAVNERTGEQLPVTSQMRRVKAIWRIFSDQGRRVGVVGWWATWPAETVHGAIVSDHTCYHFLFADGAGAGGERTGTFYPLELGEELAPLIRRPGRSPTTSATSNGRWRLPTPTAASASTCGKHSGPICSWSTSRASTRPPTSSAISFAPRASPESWRRSSGGSATRSSRCTSTRIGWWASSWR
jgi:hypothetical protein